MAVSALGLASAGPVRADDLDDVRALLAREEQKVAALEKRVAERNNPPLVPEAALRGIVAEYLGQNPGAGMPAGVQLGYNADGGFFIRSTPRPSFARWDDESRIPFELRLRGTIDVDYTYYKVNDTLNHQTGATVANPVEDQAGLTVKRVQLTCSGTAVDPNLRYSIRLEGNSVGLSGVPDTHLTNAQFRRFEDGEDDLSTNSIGNSLRLGQQTYIAYDLHPCSIENGCGPECPEGQVRYAPTLTLLAGQLVPLLGLEGYLGATSGALIERGIAGSYFNVGRTATAGAQFKALDDRLYFQVLLINGYQGQTPNSDLDDLPGLNVGVWYDFGGNWNTEQKRWDLFGTTLVDLDYSCCPVLRFGGGLAAIPLDSRELYGDAESGALRVMPAPPLGQRLISVLNGGPEGSSNSKQFLDPYALNSLDAYTACTFLAGKYRGFNGIVEFWMRDLTSLATQASGQGNLVYLDAHGNPALFPAGHDLFDYGMTTQVGYFLVPKKLFVGARWSWIRGESGNIQGDGAVLTTVSLPGITAPVSIYRDAFRVYSEADEYTLTWSYYFHGNSLKWQNDLGWYVGGNPAGSRSNSGYVPGADGLLIRSRIQLMF